MVGLLQLDAQILTAPGKTVKLSQALCTARSLCVGFMAGFNNCWLVLTLSATAFWGMSTLIVMPGSLPVQRNKLNYVIARHVRSTLFNEV